MPATTRAPVDGPLGRTYLEVTLAVLALVTIVAFEAMAVSTAMPEVAVELDAVRSYGLAFSVMLTTQLLGIVLAGVWCDRAGWPGGWLRRTSSGPLQAGDPAVLGGGRQATVVRGLEDVVEFVDVVVRVGPDCAIGR